MQTFSHILAKRRTHRAFTLVELLIVIAIISILMTAGAIGLGGISGGKSVGSAVATTESLFDEARAIATSNRTNVKVLVAKDLTRSPQENLRRIIVMMEKTDDDGRPNGEWEMTSRGLILPEQVFFSETYSREDHDGGGGGIGTWTPTNARPAFAGEYFSYDFNAEGICTTPGASFVVGTGVRQNPTASPRVTGTAKRDFGGFVIWRNGSTSLFRSPDQIGVPANPTTF